MKKHLLFGVAAFASLAMVAQSPYRTSSNPKISRGTPFKMVPSHENYVKPATVKNRLQKTSGAPYKRISGSANAFGVISTEVRALQYNEALNTVGFTFRKGNSWAGVPNGNSGTVCYAYSSNNGSTWDSTVVAANSTHFHRYPTGVMYNPTGNTNPANAYAVVSGPWHPGSNWQGDFFGSKQLSIPGSNTNGNVIYNDNLALSAGQVKQDFARTDMQACSNGNIYVLADLMVDANATTAAAQAWRGTIINKGVFNAGAFTWTVDSLKPNFKPDSNTGDIQQYSTTNMAWSEDGLIGYVVFYGVDANAMPATPQNAYQPYVFKTNDGGTTWNRHAALFDFTSIPAISNRLFATQNYTNLAKPRLDPSEGSSATVDANGNLHLFVAMNSSFWEDVAGGNTDSTFYSYAPNYVNVWTYLVDLTTTSTGWNAMVIDSLNNEDPLSQAADPNGVGTGNWTSSNVPMGYDARLQISRTTDGNYITYSWADSDTLVSTNHISIYPDVWMKGYDVVNNKMTCKKDMSATKLGIQYNSFWFFASPRIAKPNGTTLQIPFTVTQSDDGSNNGDIDVSHYYIDDATFVTSDFTVNPNAAGCDFNVGIKENTTSVAGLNFYPNPASTNGTIEVVLVENAKMDVVVMNAVGQTVMTKTIDGFAGSNKVDINTSNLTSGLYFYQVKVANSKAVTQKFVVEK